MFCLLIYLRIKQSLVDFIAKLPQVKATRRKFQAMVAFECGWNIKGIKIRNWDLSTIFKR